MVAVVVVVLGAGVAVMVWRPWTGCRAPGELCSALKRIKASDGVLDADLDYTLTRRDAKDGDSARASWTVRLADDLSPQVAGSDARQVSDLAKQSGVIGVTIDHVVELVAGEPSGTNVIIYPLMINAGDDPATAVTRAYTLRNAGASRVDGGGVQATDDRTLLKLANLAADQGYRISLALTDGSVRYETYTVVVPADVRLALAAGALDDVDSAVLSGDRSLNVHTTSADDSSRTAAVLQWLSKRKPPNGTPTKYVLSSPGYTRLRQGWIGRQRPPAAKRHGPALPEGVTPWPQDTSAPDCTGGDLKITISRPDAAAGSRYLALLARNTSGRPCALDGVPKLIFRNPTGKPQQDVTFLPAGEGVVSRRVVVPAGSRAIATIKWQAMSTANDPDVTSSVQVSAVPGAKPVRLTPRDEHGPTTLDILDGAEVAVGPWAQAVDGWSVP